MKRPLAALLFLTVLIALVALAGPARGADGAPWPGCKAFTTQPEAQAFWEANGRPRIGDADGDGRPCESLPAGSTSQPSPQPTPTGGSCTLTKRTITVKLDKSKYPKTADHLADAVRSRALGGKGKPKVMHIDRAGADENRKQSLKGIPTKKGYDRDEYPMAVSREGGKGADVRYVPSSDNRGAGSSVGMQLRKYCDGQAFQVKIVK